MKKLILVLLLILPFYLSAYDIEKITSAKVVKIIDGDTISVQIGKKIEKIRLLGIQAPEISVIPVWEYGYESKDYLQGILHNKTVDIEYVKGQKTDKYSRILGVIFLNGENINLKMVKNGFAFVYILNDSKIIGINELIEAEDKAIIKQINMFSSRKYIPIIPQHALNYLNDYKIIDGRVKTVHKTKNSVWLQMEESGNMGFSVRLDNKFVKENNINADDFKGKTIRVRGFIERYSTKFGAFVNVKSPLAIRVMLE